MSISLDDAAWGSLVGGVLIGAYREETGEFEFEEVDVKYFQSPRFEARTYLEAATYAASNLLSKLKVPKDEPVTVCSGYCLEGIRQMLEVEGYDWETGKIRGPLQEKIESAVLEYVRGIGLDVDYETLTQKRGLYFFKCVSWLHGGDACRNPRAIPEREALCKSGWASFRIWADNPYLEAKKLAASTKRDKSAARWGRGRRWEDE